MQTALVTGSASGIGRATAQRLARSGWDVYATDVDEDGLDDLADECNVARMDVTDQGEVDVVVEEIREEAGRIDCLVNNAGYGQMGPVEDVPLERMQAQFDVNVFGAVRCIKAVLPVMREQAGGTIINVASVQARATTPGWGTYSASKAALERLSDALRVEVDDLGVDVVVVEPAWVSTAFADTVAAHLEGVDRRECYAGVYESLLGEGMVEGGRFSITPDQVGRKIRTIAEADSPRSRYTLTLPAKLVVLTRLLPDAVRDRTNKWIMRSRSEPQ